MVKVWEIKKLRDLSQEEKKHLLQDAYDLGFKYEQGAAKFIFVSVE